MSVKILRALLSCSDRTGLVEFAKGLEDLGVELISTGGTGKALRDAGLKVIDVSDWTGFPEIMDGRVKTLHPKVHGAILRKRHNQKHDAEAAAHGIGEIDLVVVNLYPFEQTIAKPGIAVEEAIEQIDIGGPAMLRSAAKNHAFVVVVTNPSQYAIVLEEMQVDNEACVSQETRGELAYEAFTLTASYDIAIANYLAARRGIKFPNVLLRKFMKVRDSRYAENRHQKGALYRSRDVSEPCVVNAKLLTGGNDLTHNNVVDASAALELVKEFGDPTVAIIKHTNPVGCCLAEEIVDAYHRAYLAEVNAAMGGIIAVNRPVTSGFANAIVSTYKQWGKAAGAGGFFAEVIVAPAFDEEAVRIIRAREGWGNEVRLLETGSLTGQRNNELAFRYVPGGALFQERDLLALNEEKWKVVTKRQPTPDELRDLRFTWLVCKHAKSNAIVLGKDRTVLGAGFGQASRVNSVMLSDLFAKHYGGEKNHDNSGSVLASDAFFPFPDGAEAAAKAGATAIIQPGGSKKDDLVIARADELGMAMIFTDTRHFNH